MRIGALSDSHGRAARLAAAVELLAGRGVQAVLHCGDIGSTACVRRLAQAAVPVYLAMGNMDRSVIGLTAAAAAAGLAFSWTFLQVPLGPGEFLAVTHGHDQTLLAQLLAGGRFPYVFHGHTHRLRDERVGASRVINPGALHHSRSPGHPTAVVLDTDTGTLEVLDVPA